MTKNRFENWFGDDSLSGRDEDRLDRGGFSREIARALNRIREHSDSSVMSLVGPWGSGKTSLLALIKRELIGAESKNAETHWLTADFNPWAFADTDAVQVGFFAELRRTLADSGWKDHDKTIAKLARVAAPFSVAGSPVGLNMQDSLSTVSQYLDQRSATKVKARAEDALAKQERPILFIIDDLDRLSADELMRVFKLVRLVGRLPNVYYLLCFDEQTLVDMIEKTDLVSDSSPRRAIEYLEKIIQVRFDVPAMRAYQAEAVLNRALEYFTNERGAVLRGDATSRLSMLLSDALMERLVTPRALRRYLAQVDTFLDAVLPEVDFVDFLAVTWIRTFEPGAYKWIQRRKVELLGADGITLRHLSKEPVEVRKRVWARELEESRVTPGDVETLLYVLSRLFPAADGVYQSDYAKGKWAPPEKGVGDSDYFDRYFNFGVPEEDIPDSVIMAALRAMTNGDDDVASKRVELSLAKDAALTLRKLKAAIQRSGNSSVNQIEWMATHAVVLPDSAQGIWSVRDRYSDLIAMMMRRADVTELVQRTPAIARDESSLWVLGSAHDSLRRQTFGAQAEINSAHKAASALCPTMIELYASAFARVRDLSPLDIPRDTWSLRWFWEGLDRDGLEAFFKEQYATSRWSALSIMAALLPVTYPIDSTDSIGLLSTDDLSPHFLVDLAAALKEAEDLPRTGKGPSMFRHARATKENRYGLAMALLEEEEDNRSAPHWGRG